MDDPDPDELTLVTAAEADHETAQTAGLPRLDGVSSETTAASNVWLGQPTGEPGMDSEPHHHGEAETAGYIMSGHAEIFYGENYDRKVEMGPGDFVYIPPYLKHVERNASATEPVEFVTARSPDNIVVNLDEEPDIPPR
jgi:uncharacterized RmlC-like cupin family protein